MTKGTEEATTELERANENLRKEIADRKQAEKALRGSERHFRTLFEATSAAVLTMDERSFTDCNTAALKIFGYTRDELLGKHPAELSPPVQPNGQASAEAAEAHLEKLFREGTSRFEWTHRRKDGTDFPCEVLLTAVEEEGRQIVQGVVMDITERKRTEAMLREASAKLEKEVQERTTELRSAYEALRDSEKKYQTLYDGAPDMYVSVSAATGRILQCNRTLARALGYTKEEIIGRPIFDMYHPDSVDDAQKAFKSFVESGEVKDAELQLKRKDSSKINISLNVSAVRDEEGNILYSNSIWHDITERKKAEKALERLGRQNELILKSAGEGIYGLDENGITTFINPAGAGMIGWEVEELIGRSQHAVLHHSRPDGTPYPQEECPIYAAFRDGAVHRVDSEVFWKRDGTCFPVEYVSTPILEGGKLAGAVVTFRDITERKKAEREIEAKNRELESLLFVASHDLREPLRAIESFSRMVTDLYCDRLDEKGRDFLDRVVKGSVRMRSLLDDLLTLSRARRIEDTEEEAEGEIIVRGALDRLDESINRTSAKVKIVEGLPRLRANRAWATHAVYNLIANALKFTCGNEPPEVEVAPYLPDDATRDEVGVVVRDRGPGVKPEQAERIFRLFERAVGREIEGTGAGLAIVRTVAEGHGGRAWVQQRKGGGSEFIITFGGPPLREEADEKAKD